ncbi:MAG: peroxidase-related enzyme [Lentimicrobium sp.]|nr:peroxidase-related enzyme [Lentimicrobium sp.]
MSRIKVIPFEQATGRLKDIYDELLIKRGKLAKVHTIQSLHPESIVKHIDLYLEIMFSKSELSRAEREMMAVVVSAENSCEYCQTHHAEALNHYWKNEQKINELRMDYTKVSLTLKEQILCSFASALTNNPESFMTLDYTQLLRENGLSDNAILDATLVVAYFNFVNRIILALGVEAEAEETQGYIY